MYPSGSARYVCDTIPPCSHRVSKRPGELTDRCDDAFVFFHVRQYVSEVAHSSLRTGEIFLELSLRLSPASPGNP